MAQNNAYDYSADIYRDGGGLADYTSSSRPYPSGAAYSRPRSAGPVSDDFKKDMLLAGLSGGSSSIIGLAQGKLPFQSLFGGDDRPSKPYWQKLANKEWAQGNAALSAYAQLYEPTLRMAQRSAADYGDLYRRAANDQLNFEIRSTTTKRNADLSDFARLGPDYVNSLRGTNPLLARYYDTAESNLKLGSSLSPQQEAELEQYVRGGQAARGMGRGPVDIYGEALAKTSYGESLRQQRMQEAGGAIGLYGDIFQATTGRPTMSPEPRGANINAPNSGIGIQDYLSIGVNDALQRANLNAADKAGTKALIGQVIGSAAGIGGMALAGCWVAREVYGPENPRWKQFRLWMFTKAPGRLLDAYLRKGEAFAHWLRQHPEHKADVRAWMELQLN